MYIYIHMIPYHLSSGKNPANFWVARLATCPRYICTSCYGKYPVISIYLQGFEYPKWLAGFLPSTASILCFKASSKPPTELSSKAQFATKWVAKEPQNPHGAHGDGKKIPKPKNLLAPQKLDFLPCLGIGADADLAGARCLHQRSLMEVDFREYLLCLNYVFK